MNAVQSMIDKFVAAAEKAYTEAGKLMRLLGLAHGMVMGSAVLSYLILVRFGVYLLYYNFRKTGYDPSGTVPENASCDPNAAGVFGALLGISFAAGVIPQVSVGIEAFADARAACYPATQVINRKFGDEADLTKVLYRSAEV